MFLTIDPLQDPVTSYGINYTGTQVTQWDFQNKGKSGWTGTSFFVLEVPLRYLRPSIIYFVPCDRILQRAYWELLDHICNLGNGLELACNGGFCEGISSKRDESHLHFKRFPALASIASKFQSKAKHTKMVHSDDFFRSYFNGDMSTRYTFLAITVLGFRERRMPRFS